LRAGLTEARDVDGERFLQRPARLEGQRVERRAGPPRRFPEAIARGCVIRREEAFGVRVQYGDLGFLAPRAISRVRGTQLL